MGRRLLIIRFSAIGDLLLTAPVLQCLASCGHDLTLVVKRSHKSAAEVLPGVDEQLIWEDAQAGLIEHGKGRYDAVIDLQERTSLNSSQENWAFRFLLFTSLISNDGYYS